MKKLLSGLCLAALLAAPSSLFGQLSVGAQGGWGSDFDWAVGGRLTLQFEGPRVPVALIGSYDWFFPQRSVNIDVEYWEANVNLIFVQPALGDVSTYGGIGVNVASVKTQTMPGGTSVSSTDVGANVVGGAKVVSGRLNPFFEMRFEIGGGEQFVVVLGLDVRLGR